MPKKVEKGRRQVIKNGNMSKSLKLEAIKIAYLEIKGTEIKDINTHPLRHGGANELHLVVYKDM